MKEITDCDIESTIRDLIDYQSCHTLDGEGKIAHRGVAKMIASLDFDGITLQLHDGQHLLPEVFTIRVKRRKRVPVRRDR